MTKSAQGRFYDKRALNNSGRRTYRRTIRGTRTKNRRSQPSLHLGVIVTMSKSAWGHAEPLTQVNIDNNTCRPKVCPNITLCVRKVRIWCSLFVIESYVKAQLRNIRRTQLSVLIVPAPFATSAGVELLPRPQNHTLMKLFVRSNAYLQSLLIGPRDVSGVGAAHHPPPFALNDGP